MTRRTAIAIGLAAPVWAYAPKEFWNEREPADWTDEERHVMLTKSPWAREASVNYNSGPGNVGAARPGRTMGGGYGGGTSRRTGGGGTGGGAGAPDPDMATINGKYQAIVRWESAQPVREALRPPSKDDPAANYIINVSGNLPMLGPRSNDESESDFQQRLEMLKQYTKLEKKSDAIFLTKLGYRNGSDGGALFYFERNDLIALADHQVTFVTRLGPIDVKAKFTLKEMLYHGKLEL
jgi:hypothetical protein